MSDVIKLTPYREALKMGKEKIAAALVPIRAKRARKKAELEMCKLEEKIATGEANLHEMCAEEDLNFEAIIEKQDDLALLMRRKEQYEVILEQMFPED